MAVLDTSVYVALLDPRDAMYPVSQAWLARAIAEGERIAAPWLLVAEVAGAISRIRGDAPAAERVANHLVTAGVIDLVAVGPALARQAATIAAQQGIKGCDAVFVALAARLGDVLVTLDKQQATRAAAVVAVHQPS